MKRILSTAPVRPASRLLYVVVAGGISFLSATVFARTFYYLGLPHGPMQSSAFFQTLIVGCYAVLAPLLETSIMAALFWSLAKFSISSDAAVFICAGLLSLMHAPDFGGVHGIIVFFPFVVFSICFLAYRRISFRDAFWMTAATHCVTNVLATIFEYVAP